MGRRSPKQVNNAPRERQDQRRSAANEEDHGHIEGKGAGSVREEDKEAESLENEFEWRPAFVEGDQAGVDAGADL